MNSNLLCDNISDVENRIEQMVALKNIRVAPITIAEQEINKLIVNVEWRLMLKQRK